MSASSKCVYFTRANPAKAVDIKTVDSDLLCGETVGMPLESLQSMITNVFRPLITSQQEWVKCSEDQVKPMLLPLPFPLHCPCSQMRP